MHKRPVAVLISDTHYSLSTYKIADIAWRMAVDKAAELQVPLIDAGDIVNDKAILRAEVVNTLIETMKYAKQREVTVYCLVGNHDLVNEKGREHSLNFLAPYCTVIDTARPLSISGQRVEFIPYQANLVEFKANLDSSWKESVVIAHQGTKGGAMGDYIQDHSAFDPEIAQGRRIFCGHYHKHYTIGSAVSIGNPYTLTSGEAKDPPKGFLVLYSDGSFERVLTGLRKHVILEVEWDKIPYATQYEPEDLLWLKVTGPKDKLDLLNKHEIGKGLQGHSNFKLDLIPTEATPEPLPEEKPKSQIEIMDQIIDNTGSTSEHKNYLKCLYRDLL